MANGSFRNVLKRADQFFAAVAAEQPQNLQCGKGCSLCCHGLFEIGSGDVPMIAEGLERLDPVRRSEVIQRARDIMKSTRHPNLRDCTPAEKEAFFSRGVSTPCPNLDEGGACLVYESRPLVCRTFGLPLRDGETFIGDVCELNFTEATRPEIERASWDLQWEDELGPEDEFTIPEAVVMTARLRGW